MSEQVETLPLPEVDFNSQQPTRKVTYRPGEVNLVDISLDGEVVSSYVQFEAARLIRMAVRPQVVPGRAEGESPRTWLVMTGGIILDGLEVGLVNDAGDTVPHEMFSNPRYTQYRERPHRINAQQWVRTKHLDRLIELGEHLRKNHNFRADIHPSNRPRPGSNRPARKTRDLFRVRPATRPDPANPRNFGVALDSFEISVNQSYDAGFSSFYEGLTEQQRRWEQAASQTNDKLRTHQMNQLAQNVHFIGGVHYDEKQKEHWARAVDVGIINVDGQEFPLYPVSGEELEAHELRALLDTLVEANGGGESAEGPAGPELSLPAPDLGTALENVQF